ncbi:MULTISPECIES: helix-turn-helix domain-containing protein [Acinetobacter]
MLGICAKKLKKNGNSCREIATLLNVSKSTIANWLKWSRFNE